MLKKILRLRTILKSNPYADRFRIQLLISYIRLTLKKMVFSKSSDIERIAGYKVSHFNIKHLFDLFLSIFVDSTYYFKADSKSPFIIDCGSNIGMSVLFFKKLYPDANIIAFEPDSKCFSKLQGNINLNELTNIQIHQKALSDRDGTITFYSDPNDPGSLYMSTIKERMPKASQEVQCVTLSNYITKEVDFLKLDVEGAELQIMDELRRSNKLGYIKEMSIEYHHHILKDTDAFSKLLQ